MFDYRCEMRTDVDEEAMTSAKRVSFTATRARDFAADYRYSDRCRTLAKYRREDITT